MQGPIYSNFPDAITFFTGYAAYSLPLEFNPFTLTVNPQLAAEIKRMGIDMKGNNGVLVIFRTDTWRPYLPTEAELFDLFALVPRMEGKDGTIYSWKGGS